MRRRRESVSAEPPPLLACIRRNYLAYAAVDHVRCFSVNVLEAEDQTMAQVAARQIIPESGDYFSCSDWPAFKPGRYVVAPTAGMLTSMGWHWLTDG